MSDRVQALVLAYEARLLGSGRLQPRKDEQPNRRREPQSDEHRVRPPPTVGRCSVQRDHATADRGDRLQLLQGRLVHRKNLSGQGHPSLVPDAQEAGGDLGVVLSASAPKLDVSTAAMWDTLHTFWR